METGIKELRCGQCGGSIHKLYLRENGEIIAECVTCMSQSELTVITPKIKIRNNNGPGTLCLFN